MPGETNSGRALKKQEHVSGQLYVYLGVWCLYPPIPCNWRVLIFASCSDTELFPLLKGMECLLTLEWSPPTDLAKEAALRAVSVHWRMCACLNLVYFSF